MASSRTIVCLVTDRHRFTDEGRMVRLVAAAAAAGIDLVQIRERTLDDRQLDALRSDLDGVGFFNAYTT